tara:strand:+ start:164 stop:388 length:225 start_codon:yes stop_codon:yes gene_type:complete
MGQMKTLSILDIGEKIAIKDKENNITYVGKILDILDYWDHDVYHVEYGDGNGMTQHTTVSAADIDLIKQRELNQ